MMARKIRCANCNEQIPSSSDRLVLHYRQKGKMQQSTFCNLKCANAWQSDKPEEKKELEDEINKAVDESKTAQTTQEAAYQAPPEDASADNYAEIRQMIYENDKISEDQKKELFEQMDQNGESAKKDTALSLVYDASTNRYRKVMAPFSMVDKLKELKVIDDIYTREPV